MRHSLGLLLFLFFFVLVSQSFASSKKNSKVIPIRKAILVEDLEVEFSCLSHLNYLEHDYPDIQQTRLFGENYFLKPDGDSYTKALEVLYTRNPKDNSRGYLVISPNGAIFHKQSDLSFASQIEKGQKKFGGVKDRYQARLTNENVEVPDVFIRHDVKHYYDLNERIDFHDFDKDPGAGTFTSVDYIWDGPSATEVSRPEESFSIEDIKKLLYPYIAKKLENLGKAIQYKKPPFYQRALDAFVRCRDIKVNPAHADRSVFSVTEPDQRIRDQVTANIKILTTPNRDNPGRYYYLGAIDPEYEKDKHIELFLDENEKPKMVKGKLPSKSKGKH